MKLRAARYVEKGLALVSITALAAAKQEWPVGVWPSVDAIAPWYVVVFLVVGGVFSMSPLSEFLEHRKRPQRDVERRRIMKAYGAMLTKAAKAELPLSDPAIHVWRKGHVRLKRIVTYRLDEGNLLRQFAPKKGQGVAGLCWRDASPKGCDVEALATQLKDSQALASLPGDDVMNLTWESLRKVKHRGAVFAAPIMRRDKVVGVVSFDASSKYQELAKAGIPEDLNSLAASLTDSLEYL
jgi:hypothetical protein